MIKVYARLKIDGVYAYNILDTICPETESSRTGYSRIILFVIIKVHT